MALISSTGIFKYIPPNPIITSISSPTGYFGDIISIFGEDLDYVDRLLLGDQNLNFSLINSSQKINFVVPSDPNTGNLIIESNTFTITGQKNIPFLSIFQLNDFYPKNGSEGDTIYINGKVLTSVVDAYIYGSPVLDDIDFYLSGDRNVFSIPMSKKSGVSEINLVENFNKNSEINNFKLFNVDNFNYSSGRSLNLKYEKTSDLNQKYYENHLLSISGFTCPDFQSFKTGLGSGSSIYAINIPSGLNNSDYAVFYNLIQTGNNYIDSYISGKTSSSFNLITSQTLSYPTILNVLLMKTSGFIFDSGVFERGSINITQNTTGQTIYFDRLSGVDRDSNLYSPFVFTSKERISGANIGNSFFQTNLYNLQKDYFSIHIPNATAGQIFCLNYLTIFNSGMNLAKFVSDNEYSYYKKIYLLSGNVDTFQEKIKVKNLNIGNKNSGNFEVPSTDYHLNGRIELINQSGMPRSYGYNFIETPTPLGVFPVNGVRGSNIVISGKSFKTPILIDSPYEYNGCLVRFKYIDDLYAENKSTFETSFRVISKDLLSGYIPLSNIPTGRYIIQMISENGGLFE